MVLLECLGDRVSSVPIQIFGTDISEVSIEKARAGVYSESSLGEVSQERLRRFFVKVEGGFQIAKSLREMCVFARQDLAQDPPFSRLDLISCRNVLIYMGPVLQKKVMGIFHYALKPTGFLMLGKSESIERLHGPLHGGRPGAQDLFEKACRTEPGFRSVLRREVTRKPWERRL